MHRVDHWYPQRRPRTWQDPHGGRSRAPRARARDLLRPNPTCRRRNGNDEQPYRSDQSRASGSGRPCGSASSARSGPARRRRDGAKAHARAHSRGELSSLELFRTQPRSLLFPFFLATGGEAVLFSSICTMSRRLRLLDNESGIVEVSSRTIHRRFLTRPSAEVNKLILGILGRPKPSILSRYSPSYSYPITTYDQLVISCVMCSAELCGVAGRWAGGQCN